MCDRQPNKSDNIPTTKSKTDMNTDCCRFRGHKISEFGLLRLAATCRRRYAALFA